MDLLEYAQEHPKAKFQAAQMGAAFFGGFMKGYLNERYYEDEKFKYEDELFSAFFSAVSEGTEDLLYAAAETGEELNITDGLEFAATAGAWRAGTEAGERYGENPIGELDPEYRL